VLPQQDVDNKIIPGDSRPDCHADRRGYKEHVTRYSEMLAEILR
jgi:hypothetical protein